MMKNNTLLYIIAFCSLCCPACTEHEAFHDQAAEEISLSAVVDEVKCVSRAVEDAYTGSVPSPENKLEAAVWFSLKSGYYPEELPDDATEEEQTLKTETNIPLHGQINYISGTATFPESTTEADKPKYPVNGNDVYCVGLYPNDEDWTTIENDTKVQRTITGTEDLMFAPEITGNWNNHFTSQRYRHLLTWLKVGVCTTTSEAASYWGKLKKITLKGVPNTLTIDLGKQEGDGFKLENTVTYSSDNPDTQEIEGIQDLPIFNPETGIDIAITTQEVASVFCHPSPTYTISIECENGTTTDIPITLEALNQAEVALLQYPAGLQYVLILYFHPFNVVEGVCTLNAWNAQNEDLYPD